MALAVAEAHGYDPSVIQPVLSASVDRGGVPSPADISMDSSRLQAELHLQLTPFRAALKHIFAEHDHPHEQH